MGTKRKAFFFFSLAFNVSLNVSALPLNPLDSPDLRDQNTLKKLTSSYQENCSHCHSGNAPTAPRIGDNAEWSKRLSAGFDHLYASAIHGIPNTAMLPKGGHSELTNEEVKNLVNYLLLVAKMDNDVIVAAMKYDGLHIHDSEFISLDHARRGYLEKQYLKNEKMYLSKFDQFDLNRDGLLSETEFTQLRSDLLQQQRSTKVSDEQLQENIVNALATVKGMPPAGIRVAVKNGQASLQGVVGDSTVLRYAFNTVRWLPGIQKLDNRLMTAEMLAFD